KVISHGGKEGIAITVFYGPPETESVCCSSGVVIHFCGHIIPARKAAFSITLYNQAQAFHYGITFKVACTATLCQPGIKAYPRCLGCETIGPPGDAVTSGQLTCYGYKAEPGCSPPSLSAGILRQCGCHEVINRAAKDGCQWRNVFLCEGLQECLSRGAIPFPSPRGESVRQSCSIRHAVQLLE